MKKVCCLVCLILLLLAMALPVGAEEYFEDSVTIPEEVLACLDMESVDTVFCVYVFGSQFVRCTYSGFVYYGDIDRMLANVAEPELQRYYFVKDKAGETEVYAYDGMGLSKGYIGHGSWFERHGEKAASIIRKIDADIVVENIYYLWYHNWTAIYYKTNLGDYIYVSGGYLMAREPFLALQEELYELSVKYKDWRNLINEPYQVKLSEAQADLSPYDMDAPDFDPHAPLNVHRNYKPGKLITIGSLVLLVALVVGRFLIRGHRKYRAQKDKQRYWF